MKPLFPTPLRVVNSGPYARLIEDAEHNLVATVAQGMYASAQELEQRARFYAEIPELLETLFAEIWDPRWSESRLDAEEHVTLNIPESALNRLEGLLRYATGHTAEVKR